MLTSGIAEEVVDLARKPGMRPSTQTRAEPLAWGLYGTVAGAQLQDGETSPGWTNQRVDSNFIDSYVMAKRL
jgi:hypothetical protein